MKGRGGTAGNLVHDTQSKTQPREDKRDDCGLPGSESDPPCPTDRLWSCCGENQEHQEHQARFHLTDDKTPTVVVKKAWKALHLFRKLNRPDLSPSG